MITFIKSIDYATVAVIVGFAILILAAAVDLYILYCFDPNAIQQIVDVIKEVL